MQWQGKSRGVLQWSDNPSAVSEQQSKLQCHPEVQQQPAGKGCILCIWEVNTGKEQPILMISLTRWGAKKDQRTPRGSAGTGWISHRRPSLASLGNILGSGSKNVYLECWPGAGYFWLSTLHWSPWESSTNFASWRFHIWLVHVVPWSNIQQPQNFTSAKSGTILCSAAGAEEWEEQSKSWKQSWVKN